MASIVKQKAMIISASKKGKQPKSIKGLKVSSSKPQPKPNHHEAKEDSIFEPKSESAPSTSFTPIVEEGDDLGSSQEQQKDRLPARQQKVSKKALFFSFLATFLLTGMLAGGIFYSKKAIKDQDTDQESKPSPAVSTPSPVKTNLVPSSSPSASPKIILNKYKVNILNGSGVPGEAAAVGEMLLEKGFGESKTGNASSYSYQETEVRLKKGTPKKVFTAIQEALDNMYKLTLGTALDKSSEFDVIIIVGKKI